MPINKTATPGQNLSFKNDIVNEFTDVAPHALSEFYGVDDPLVPTSGEIKFSDFCGAATKTLVNYSIIGGGGAGGYGRNKGSSGKGTFAQAGTATTITSTTLGTITSAGGVGGENAASGTSGTAGVNSTQGTGGLAGKPNSAGGNATGYGAGGGGAGGDRPSLFDNSGAGGLGGGAATTVTGSALIRYGEVITITVGTKGIGVAASYKGGDGSSGNCIISYNGKSFVVLANSTHTVTK